MLKYKHSRKKCCNTTEKYHLLWYVQCWLLNGKVPNVSKFHLPSACFSKTRFERPVSSYFCRSCLAKAKYFVQTEHSLGPCDLAQMQWHFGEAIINVAFTESLRLLVRPGRGIKKKKLRGAGGTLCSHSERLSCTRLLF